MIVVVYLKDNPKGIMFKDVEAFVCANGKYTITIDRQNNRFFSYFTHKVASVICR